MYDKYDSVLLIGTLNVFARKTGNGIIDFETYADSPEEHEDWLVYDKSTGRVVCDMCVDEIHRDIVDYYEDIFADIEIKVVADDDDESDLFVDVTLPRGSIVVEDGAWYVSCYD